MSNSAKRRVLFARVHEEHYLAYHGTELVAEVTRDMSDLHWNIEFTDGRTADGFITVAGFKKFIEDSIRIGNSIDYNRPVCKDEDIYTSTFL